MTTTRTRSITVTVGELEIRARMDAQGVVTVAHMQIGKIVRCGEQYKPASLSGVAGRGFDLQREAIVALVERHYKRAMSPALAH